ncbi:MAG: M23 family metallopeptidase, partial [Ilumatobacteraceae bacterium]
MRLAVLFTSVLSVTGCASMDGGNVPGTDTGGVGSVNGGKSDSTQRALIQSDWRLPWSCGERYYVSQGNDGDLCTATNGDHILIQDYAWDFALPRHTPVLSAREGVVTLALNVQQQGDSCYDGCRYPFNSTDFADCCKSCLLLANRVNVKHADGSVSTYWHLDQATVQVGQHVKAGDLLGYSGTSGCSTGPHLHFQVMNNCPTGYCQSKPIEFAESVIVGAAAEHRPRVILRVPAV